MSKAIGERIKRVICRPCLSNQVPTADTVEMQKTILWDRWTAILYTVVASLSYVSTGMMVAWSSFAYQRMDAQQLGFDLSDNLRYSLTATPVLVAALVTLVIYKCYYRIGTKAFMLTGALLMIVSSFLLTYAVNFWCISAARILAGASAGIAFTLVPSYVDEFASGQHKALLDTILAVAFPFGILLQFMADFLPAADGSGLLGAPVPILQFVGFLFLPESARFLCAADRCNHAREVLLRTHSHEAYAVQLMEDNLHRWQRSKGRPVQLVEALEREGNPWLLLPLLALPLLQAFVGVVPLTFYLHRVLDLADAGRSPALTSLYVAAMFAGAPIAYRILKLQLRGTTLLHLCAFLMAIAMATLGWQFHVRATHGPTDGYENLPLVCYGTYVTLYAIAFHRVPATLLDGHVSDENLLPLRAIAAALWWAGTYIAVRLLPMLIGTVGVGWVFWIVAVVLVLSSGFVRLTIPGHGAAGVDGDDATVRAYQEAGDRKRFATGSSSNSSVQLEQTIVSNGHGELP